MPLKKDIENKINLIANSVDGFKKSVEKSQDEILKKMLSALRKLASKEGKLVTDETNAKVLARLEKEIFEIIINSEYKDSVQRHLLDFDKIEELTKNIVESVNDIKIKDLGLNESKRRAIKELSDNLLGNKELKINVVNRFRRIMYRGIELGSTYQDVEFELNKFVKGDKKNRGHLERYVSQIANDALMQWEGTINQKVVDEYELNAFRYVGSLKKTSRINCVEMVNCSGKLAKFCISGESRSFFIEDIQKIIDASKKRPGWDPSTTVSNYFVKRGGFNCRHFAIPFFYDAEEEGNNAAVVRLDKATKRIKAAA